MSSSAIKHNMLVKNAYNLPTYFQLGRNSLEASESIFVPSEKNKGLDGSVPRGKRTNIPIAANILTKQDSGERLNLKPSISRADSPQRRLLAKLRLEERNFKETFEGKRLPDEGSADYR